MNHGKFGHFVKEGKLQICFMDIICNGIWDWSWTKYQVWTPLFGRLLCFINGCFGYNLYWNSYRNFPFKPIPIQLHTSLLFTPHFQMPIQPFLSRPWKQTWGKWELSVWLRIRLAKPGKGRRFLWIMTYSFILSAERCKKLSIPHVEIVDIRGKATE